MLELPSILCGAKRQPRSASSITSNVREADIVDAARGAISILFVVLNTVVCSSGIMLFSLLRWLIPNRSFKIRAGRIANACNDLWVAANKLVLLKFLGISQIAETWNTLEGLSKDRWYLITCNHQSWADILILQTILMAHIPTLKFFTKRELLWVPFFGTAMWLLDYPYVHRFSPEKLRRDPSSRGRDRQAIVDACRKFMHRPTGILNFLEGTRYSEAKHRHQNSPYKHLLLPKSGGIGYVCGELGSNIHRLLDVTIVYPDQIPGFWDFLCGRAKRVIVKVQVEPVPAAILAADLADNPTSKQALKTWVDELWQRKDLEIAERLRLG